jgi:hypothetical protein
MQLEHATLSADGRGLAIGVSTTPATLTPDVAALRDDDPDSNERWRAWRDRGAKSDRQSARTMNRVFVAIFVALSAWVVFQLLS